jgi:hypothetical protein
MEGKKAGDGRGLTFIGSAKTFGEPLWIGTMMVVRSGSRVGFIAEEKKFGLTSLFPNDVAVIPREGKKVSAIAI